MSRITPRGARNSLTPRVKASLPCCQQVRSTLARIWCVRAPAQVRLPPHTLRAITIPRMARSAVLLVASKPKQCRKGEQPELLMFEVARQPTVRRIPAACFQYPVQFRLQLSGHGPPAVFGDLARRIALAQLQAGPEQLLHSLWESPCRRRGDLCHLTAALEQMGQTTLMERKLEPIIGCPAVMNQKSIIFGPQNLHRLLVSAARQNGVDGHLRAHRHVQPLELPAHSPAGFVHAVHRSLPRGFHQSVIGRRRPARHPRQGPIQPSATDLQPESIAQDLSRVPQRQPHLLVQNRRQGQRFRPQLHATDSHCIRGL